MIVADRGCETGIDNVLPADDDFAGAVEQVSPADANAEIFFCRFQRHGGFAA